MKIAILVEMDTDTSMLNITATPEVPNPIVLAIVTSAYHEVLSKKMQIDFDTSIRVAGSMPSEPRRFRG